MKNKYAKIFLDRVDNKILPISYSPTQDEYYKIVKENCQKGYKQIIITSNMMTSILKKYFYDKKFNIATLEFMEEDEALKTEVELILAKMRQERGYFGELLNKICFLSTESAIDIKKIELKGRNDKDSAVSILLQVNGIFGINEKCFDEESKILLQMIEGCLD